MTRPVFETEADRAREAAVAAALSLAWDCTMVPAARLAGYDYLAVRGTDRAVVEIKSRLNRAPEDFGGVLFLNLHKRASLLAARPAGAAAVFAWHFPGRVLWVDVVNAPWPVEARGRTDRDGLDVRACYRVPLSACEEVRI